MFNQNYNNKNIYLADIRNISNMYPYGMSYPAAATYSADDDYRYGFNGMEKEKSFDGEGDVADFGARIFDANYPVFLSRDPLEKNFAFQSSYLFAKNNPIKFIDLNGEHFHDLSIKYFNAKNSIIVLNYHNLTTTHKNAINYLRRMGHDFKSNEDIHYFDVQYSGPKFFRDNDPNYRPNIIRMSRGEMRYEKNRIPLPSTIQSTNQIRIKPLIGVALLAEGVRIANEIVKIYDSFEMKEAKLQKITIERVIPDVLEEAREKGILDNTDSDDIDHLINLLMYCESDGASEKNIETYFEIVDKIIEPDATTMIEVTTGSSESDATKVSNKVKVPNKIYRETEKEDDKDG